MSTENNIITAHRPLRRQAVEAKVGMSCSTIYKLIAKGAFPRPVRLGDKAVAWLESEVDAWIASRVAARNAAPA